MQNAKALRFKDLNHLYEPIYKGDDKLNLFIEKINTWICSIKSRKQLKECNKVEFLFEERYSKLPDELFDFQSEIEMAFKDAGWYVRITPHPRWVSLILKTLPFNEKDTGSGGF